MYLHKEKVAALFLLYLLISCEYFSWIPIFEQYVSGRGDGVWLPKWLSRTVQLFEVSFTVCLVINFSVSQTIFPPLKSSSPHKNRRVFLFLFFSKDLRIKELCGSLWMYKGQWFFFALHTSCRWIWIILDGVLKTSQPSPCFWLPFSSALSSIQPLLLAHVVTSITWPHQSRCLGGGGVFKVKNF